MGKLTRALQSAAIACTLAGCAELQQQIVSGARQPGQHVMTTPERLWKESVCRQGGRPFVNVESLEILPEKVKAGARVNYRLVYSMCPADKFSEILRARVNRRLLYRGQEVASNVKDDLEFRAGRWAVDSFFTLPAATPLGVYSLEVVVAPAKGRSQKLTQSFVVSDEFYLTGE